VCGFELFVFMDALFLFSYHQIYTVAFNKNIWLKKQFTDFISPKKKSYFCFALKKNFWLKGNNICSSLPLLKVKWSVTTGLL